MASQNGPADVLKTILKIAVTVGILAFVVQKLGWQNILTTVERADWRWFAAGLVVFVVSSVLGVVQWVILLGNRGIKVPFGKAFVLYFVGILFNNFMLGMVAGDAVKVALLKNAAGKGSGRIGLAATFLDRVAGLWAMMAFAVIGSIILFHHGASAISGNIITASIALTATFLAFCFLCVLIVVKPVQDVTMSVFARLPIPAVHKERITSIIGELFLEASDHHILLPVILLSILIQTMRIAVHVLCAASLGLLTMANFQYFFVFVPMIAILMLIPLPFGVREVMAGGLFTMAGFKSDAIVMQFLVSLIGIITSAFSGILFIVNHVKIDRKETEDLL